LLDQVDCEGEILQKVRALVGPECPLVATLDMHGNVSPEMVEKADVLVAFNSNPHLDARERGLESVKLLTKVITGGIQPVSAFVHPPLLLSALTTWTRQKPLCEVHAAAAKYKSDPRVINISVMGGFAMPIRPSRSQPDRNRSGDRPAPANRGRAGKGSLGTPPDCPVSWGIIGRAVKSGCVAPKPVILADVGIAWWGYSGDGTVLLQALLLANAQDAVVTIAVAQQASPCPGCRAVAGDRQSGRTVAWRRLGSAVVEKITDGRLRAQVKIILPTCGKQVNIGQRGAPLWGVRILVTSQKTPQAIEPARSRVSSLNSKAYLWLNPRSHFEAHEPIARKLSKWIRPPAVGFGASASGDPPNLSTGPRRI
jgi:microcystin degradation protein MlrC